jgi:hypothetical protein
VDAVPTTMLDTNALVDVERPKLFAHPELS